jgi:hypothetical protein
MSLREAAQQALEALEDIADELISPYNDPIGKAILDLRTALAEPDQDDTALLRQALDCLENHVMQRTYASGVVICNTAIALRERLGEKT